LADGPLGAVLASTNAIMASRKLLAAFVILVMLVSVACSHEYFSAHPVQYEGVVVQPVDVTAGRHKLWVKVLVTNAGTEAVAVNADAIVARLASGQVVGRVVGRYTTHEVDVIPGGTSHQVDVEFAEAGFDWHRTAQVTIDFSHAITRAGVALPIEMTVAQ
jgi:hypothetical protein